MRNLALLLLASACSQVPEPSPDTLITESRVCSRRAPGNCSEWSSDLNTGSQWSCHAYKNQGEIGLFCNHLNTEDYPLVTGDCGDTLRLSLIDDTELDATYEVMVHCE